MSILPAPSLSNALPVAAERSTSSARRSSRGEAGETPGKVPGKGRPRSKPPGVAGAHALLGFELGQTQCGVVFGWADAGAVRMAGRMSLATKADPEAMLRELENAARAGLANHSLSPEAIGVCCEGPVDSRRGTIQGSAILPSWEGFEIAGRLEKTFGRPAAARSETDAHTLAEWRWGAGRGTRNMIYLTFGEAMEAGLVLDGKLYSGASDGAGAAGHLRVAEDGPEGFAKRGSLGGFCSVGGMVCLARELGLKVMSVEEIFEAMAKANPIASRAVRITAHRLGCGLALMVDLLNPERIVIGGIFADHHAVMMPLALQALQAEASSARVAACRVVPAGPEKKTGSRAALAVAAEAAFQDCIEK